MDPRECKNCGKKFIPHRYKPRDFCSQRCGNDYRKKYYEKYYDKNLKSKHKHHKPKFVTHSGIEVDNSALGQFMMKGDYKF